MTTDLEHHIQATPLVDTHEHTLKEQNYIQDGPDVIQDLFGMYLGNDVISAGLTLEEGVRALDAKNLDVESRWKIIEKFWPYCQHTGYGQGIRLAAKIMYGMDEITLETIQAAAPRNAQLRQPGERLRMLKETANLDHVQIDDFLWECAPDTSGPDFFLYDLSWVGFACGKIDFPALHEQTGVEVVDLATLRQAMTGLFDRYGDCAIAMKAQQAYERPLTWQERSDADAEYVLQRALRGEPLSEAERLCLGDWGWERGVELSVEYHLPFKIHTGFLAGNDPYVPDDTRPSHFAGLIARHPDAHFVLMHAAYPYGGELLALAKHYRGVYLDLCWAWNMNLLYTIDFVRQAIHSVPSNKLFGFGGDAFSPVNSVGHAAQARDGLARTLKAEIADGFLSEAEAITLASRFMRENQYAVFDLEGTRAAIRARIATRISPK